MATIDDLGWKCAQCTFYHQAGDTRCGMCNELRRDFVPGVLILIPKGDGGDCNAPATTSAPKTTTPSLITVPPSTPVQTHTQYSHEWTVKLQEHQAIQQDGSLFRAVRDQALRQAALYKFGADQSRRAAQQFHQNETAVAAPFDLRPASSAATATATAPDSLQKYVDGCLKRCITPAGNTAVLKQVHQGKMAVAHKEGRLHDGIFGRILKHKTKANAAFSTKNYAAAVACYDKTLALFPLYYQGVPAGQVEDHVNILSNKAECLIWLEQYPEAGMAASEALQIDSKHVKSLFRRAKASYLHALATPDDYGISPFATAQVERDLQQIISMRIGVGVGEGVAEAEALLDTMNTRVEQDLESITGDNEW
jgi:tetratricopeptide (TPR) repeat protein